MSRATGSSLQPLIERLTVPAIAAPMFLVSGPDLVVATCRGGLVGTFPSLNQRTTAGYESWLAEVESRLENATRSGETPAPFGVNLVVNRGNERLDADLAVTVGHRVPIVITSLGISPPVIEAVQSYGGLVFHDVTTVRHARKAADAGVDGIIAVCAGAGGHGGTLSPFALLSEIRSFFPGLLVLSGCISTGAHILAVRVIGADLAYLGTRFIATRESLAAPAYKTMVLSAAAEDIVYTDRLSMAHANYLRPSLVAAGLDPDNLPLPEKRRALGQARPWKDVWGAGQGVGAVQDVPAAADLCQRLGAEYAAALEGLLPARPVRLVRESDD